MVSTEAAAAQEAAAPKPSSPNSFSLLVLGALGVVYGDIGTSPIYTLRVALLADGTSMPNPGEVLGLLSLIFWALTFVVTGKYVGLVSRADNHGEGGTLSLTALARSTFRKRPKWVLVFGIVSAALFCGDAMITPAISVLSAVEGLEVVSPSLAPWVLPITFAILLCLFAAQRFGTARVSLVFGPITGVWFVSLAAIGILRITENPQVLWGLNPVLGLDYLTGHPLAAAAITGAIFLAVTGGEALYADLGHFGRRPIVAAWLIIVFPCLLLNYFGQGAYVLAHPSGEANPFFYSQPVWARVPMLVLATAATVIASQAVITGAFSLVRQAVNLNLLPRMRVQHTSETLSGQIYLPQVNFLLFLAVVLLVFGFGRSDALAAAYGVAVSGVMLITTILLFLVIWRRWHWPLAATIAVVLPFFLLDLWFVVANSMKFSAGGWVPALVAAALTAVMLTWVTGRSRLLGKMQREKLPLKDLITNLEKHPPTKVPGTAVFLTDDTQGAPTALMHSLKHYKVLHEHNAILHVQIDTRPHVPVEDRVVFERINDQFARLAIVYGYMDDPNIPKALVLCRKYGWKFDMMSTSFFLSRRSLKPSAKGGMPAWQDKLFILLAKNATDATEFFAIPAGRVVEIGTQVVV